MSRSINNILSQLLQQLQAKDDEPNLVSASFHMMTITMICMSMANLTWFTVTGNFCIPYLSLGSFFTFGYSDENLTDLRCITPLVVNMMRITILLCFMAVIFTLAAFLLDLIGPKAVTYRMVRRYSVLSICTVLWILAIISVSYYIILLLEDITEKSKLDSNITYGPGFFLLAAAGGVCLCGIFYNLILTHPASYSSRDDDRCLIDNPEDSLDTFNSPTPPPPYNIPPPPYSP